MPQTVESIKHAKAAKVPIVVAINKCDLPDADPQKIKNQLLEHELISEDLSGDTIMVEISTKTKKNIDKLLELILLQSELLDLKCDFNSNSSGVVLESKIDIGTGPIANVIITSGNLKKGDVIVGVDPRYFRPSEVNTLKGDSSKARQKLGWKPKVTINELCSEMVAEDLLAAKNELILKNN